MKIRELCENASFVWTNFKCDFYTPSQVYENVKQSAPELESLGYQQLYRNE